ncbi:MAG: Na/Pi cotransporter family protein [Bacteroidales bacterium]|nr:Na/Pi cotransporter family protein [Bacteroidales bacterium]MDD3300115.1 Na/Pi cotransporter family protein [Bacteroidales bacterium]MDD3843520.1 Na/Pi cotransporter family protein [Bacteroidales bacterium]MDD4617888.1 Na/Pi cotransporter family protein [Bacteroidales bacterium]
MDIIYQVLKVVGSLGLFLYGMTLLSESLQKVAGDKMRSILASMTSNSFKRVLTGLFITAIIQSSSATTVMVVSFVNAGLLSLAQSVGVIMGANIGTTVTAWIISLLGFKADISALSIPLIGIGFVFMMMKSGKRKSMGELIIGFALLFMGLSFLKSSVPDLRETPEILEFLKEWTSFGFLSILIFVFIGTLLTIVLQSSSATMALTLVMCSYGWIPFEMAAAMVLGENIGTTITANIAAAVANVSARRAALAHTVFNVFGIIWVLILFGPILKLVSLITVSVGAGDPFVNTSSTLYGVSFLHTLFNLTNTLLLVWFTPQIVKFVTYVIKAPKTEEVFRLQFIQGGILSTAELSLTQAKQEIVSFAKLTHRQYEYVREAIHDCEKSNFDELFAKLEHYEQITDRVELEIANYLNSISEGEISEESGKRIQAMYTIISELESVGDSGYNIARILQRKNVYKSKFDDEMVKKIDHMLDLMDNAFRHMIYNLDQGYTNIKNINNAEDAENSINEYRNHLKEEHLLNLENNIYNYQTGVFYMDLIAECEKVGDYIINVSEAIIEIQ